MSTNALETTSPVPAWAGASAEGVPTAATAAGIEARLDLVLRRLEEQEERRRDLEEVVNDLLPAVNGILRQASARLDALEQSGVLELLPLAADTLMGLAPVSSVAPLRPLRLLKVLRDPEVARGLGVLLEIVRALGASAGTPRTPGTRRS